MYKKWHEVQQKRVAVKVNVTYNCKCAKRRRGCTFERKAEMGTYKRSSKGIVDEKGNIVCKKKPNWND